jgi:cytochrome c oxidase cbb3-type subunit III
MTIRLAALSLALVALVACEREQRRFVEPTGNVAPQPRVEIATVRPGGTRAEGQPLPAPPADAKGRSDSNAYAVSQGKQLFSWYNCAGCHAHGGGGIGPPLMDSKWRYGAEPAAIYTSIVDGRPNGMPSFAGRIPETQVWQLVAYVRSMSGLVRSDVAPGRADGMQAGEPETRRERAQPTAEKPPA